jgi:hypothetical protein
MRWKDFGSANGRKSKLTRREIYKNVFIELDYLENAIQSTDSSAFAQVHNLVGTCQLRGISV